LAEAQEIERRADEIIGPHVRRLAFAEAMPSHAHLIKSALFYSATGWRRQAGNMMWPVARRIMTRMYDLGPGAAAESRAKLEAEFDWLDGKLADGRAYLAGDRFSRADLTVASLLANFARPKQLLAQHGMKGPEALAADVNRWSERPVMRWVMAQYRAHRTPTSSPSRRL
jgi:glutathione S-transferase